MAAQDGLLVGRLCHCANQRYQTGECRERSPRQMPNGPRESNGEIELQLLPLGRYWHFAHNHYNEKSRLRF
jgi:hypothetical protein